VVILINAAAFLIYHHLLFLSLLLLYQVVVRVVLAIVEVNSVVVVVFYLRRIEAIAIYIVRSRAGSRARGRQPFQHSLIAMEAILGDRKLQKRLNRKSFNGIPQLITALPSVRISLARGPW
jgi:hypothetical protein